MATCVARPPRLVVPEQLAAAILKAHNGGVMRGAGQVSDTSAVCESPVCATSVADPSKTGETI
eukprot:SAG22_NODE_1726_length_3712_cov_4.345143_2_plen_63_part_00